MPSQLHEVVVHLFREHPELVRALLRDVLHLDVAGDVVLRGAPVSIAELQPAEYRADVVFEIRDPVTHGVLQAIIFEIQLKPDEAKPYAWPFYVAGVRARLRCPVSLVVVTTKRTVARWADRAIDLDGHGRFTFRPHVIGPDRVPLILDADAARALPELAVLSALAHRRHERAADVSRVALHAVRDLDEPTAALYYDFVFANLGRAARRVLEAEMIEHYQYQSDFMKKAFSEGRTEGHVEGREQGRTEALVEAVIAVLKARGLPITDDVRTRLAATSDPDRLHAWLTRAAVVDTIDDIFSA